MHTQRMNLTSTFIDTVKNNEIRYKLLKILYTDMDVEQKTYCLKIMGYDYNQAMDQKVSDIISKAKNLSSQTVDELLEYVKTNTKEENEED